MRDKRPKQLTDKAKRPKGVTEYVDSMAIHKEKQRKKIPAVLEKKKKRPIQKKPTEPITKRIKGKLKRGRK